MKRKKQGVAGRRLSPAGWVGENKNGEAKWNHFCLRRRAGLRPHNFNNNNLSSPVKYRIDYSPIFHYL